MDALDAFRHLTAFDFRRRAKQDPSPLVGLDWPAFATLAVKHGVAALVSYKLDFQLFGAGAPEEVRDTLLGYYRGILNDNVFKLVALKQLLSEFDRPVALIEAAGYADAIYPHVAFRPLPELRLLTPRSGFFRLAELGRALEMRIEGTEGSATVFTDGRIRVLLHDALFGKEFGGPEEELLQRGIPAKAFGPKVVRPAIEDAILSHVALLAQRGFDAPLIEMVDLRELALGSPGQGGTYDGQPDATRVLQRAEKWGLSRALFCAMCAVARLFPSAEPAASRLLPRLNVAVRSVLEKAVVEPTLSMERETVNRAAEQIRKLLV
jgi:hypothetical protein